MTVKISKIWMWCARVAWAVLPVTAGGALADSLHGWSAAPARLAGAFLWAAWSFGLVALLAPRPWGLTLLRVAAPAAVAVSVASAAGAHAAPAALAVASSLVAAVGALSAPVAESAANAAAYGDERRFPLRIPAPLFAGPVPLAVTLAGAGVATGPLLLAAGRMPAGIGVTVVGLPAALVGVRSLHALGRRWLVVVPAGLVVVDPLTLLDPVLMRREQIVQLGRVRTRSAPPAVLDLRLGTAAGSVAVELAEPHSFARRRGRRDAELRDAATILVAVASPGALVELAGRRRIATTRS